MKFECGLEAEAHELKMCRERGSEISPWELYREHNRQELPQLLQKRAEENKIFAERSKKDWRYWNRQNVMVCLSSNHERPVK